MKLYTSLNKEPKLYGVNMFGLLTSVVCFVVLWLACSVMFGMGGAVVGFYYGTTVSKLWFKGIMQKYIYYHLPLKIKIQSYKRYFR